MITERQTAVLKALKRAPRTAQKLYEILSTDKKYYGSIRFTKDSVYGLLRRLENRELIRRTIVFDKKNHRTSTKWELTGYGRELI